MGKNPHQDQAAEAGQEASEAIRKAADKSLEKIEEGVDKAASVAHEVTDKALDGAEAALHKTRRALNRGLAEAEDGLHRLGQYADPRIDALAYKALDVATHSIHMMADKTERASLRAQRLSDDFNRYVRREPGKAMLMAATAGALLTILLGGRRR